MILFHDPFFIKGLFFAAYPFLLCPFATLRIKNKTQLKFHIGMQYKRVTQR